METSSRRQHQQWVAAVRSLPAARPSSGCTLPHSGSAAPSGAKRPDGGIFQELLQRSSGECAPTLPVTAAAGHSAASGTGTCHGGKAQLHLACADQCVCLKEELYHACTYSSLSESRLCIKRLCAPAGWRVSVPISVALTAASGRLDLRINLISLSWGSGLPGQGE